MSGITSRECKWRSRTSSAIDRGFLASGKLHGEFFPTLKADPLIGVDLAVFDVPTGEGRQGLARSRAVNQLHV